MDVSQIVRYGDGQEAWELVLALVRAAAGDDHTLELIGAGPLEDLVTSYPVPYLDLAEEQAKRDPDLAKALAITRYPGHE